MANPGPPCGSPVFDHFKPQRTLLLLTTYKIAKVFIFDYSSVRTGFIS